MNGLVGRDGLDELTEGATGRRIGAIGARRGDEVGRRVAGDAERSAIVCETKERLERPVKLQQLMGPEIDLCGLRVAPSERLEREIVAFTALSLALEI